MKHLILLFVALIHAIPAMAQFSIEDMSKFKNDKEVIISSFSHKDAQRIKKKFTDKEIIKKYASIFSNTMLKFLNSDERKCDLRLIDDLNSVVGKMTTPTEESFKEYLKVLRVNHHIDDILFEILNENASIYFGLKDLKVSNKLKVMMPSTHDLFKTNNIEKLFETLETFPDEKQSCLLSEYVFIFDNVRDENDKPALSTKKFKKLLEAAYALGSISLEIYRKVEYLANKTEVHERSIWLNDYFKIIFNAKNKMIPIKNTYVMTDIESEDDFASERVRRFSKITRRKLLYKKYNETQIVLLAQLLQKASRRMGSDPDTITKIPTISQEFSVLTQDGERETYVEVIELDPQSQYNLARRLLRKDMTELQMMDIFVKQKITHEDIVMASLETGYISLTDLEFVVRYDDLWNPEISKFQRVSGFIFKVAGYGSFFLPPPWNVTATIALGIAEGIVNNKNRTGVDNDNPATFIE